MTCKKCGVQRRRAIENCPVCLTKSSYRYLTKKEIADRKLDIIQTIKDLRDNNTSWEEVARKVNLAKTTTITYWRKYKYLVS